MPDMSGASATGSWPSRLRRHRGLRAVVRWGLRAALVVALLAAGYVVTVYVRHDRPVALPAPTGPHPVGRAIFTWTDPSRADPLSPDDPPGPRRLSVWLWFPAAGSSTGTAAPYLPGAWQGLHLPGPAGWGESAFDRVDVHTLSHADIAAGRFPVVVLLPGLGLSAPQYSALAVDLASHGYLVAGVTPTYSANLTVLHGQAVQASSLGNPSGFSGGHGGASTRTALRLMRVWSADAKFAAGRVRALGSGGRFAGHIDTTRVAYVGHSFGGTSALEACRTDPRCVGAADLDGAEFGGVVDQGLRVPLLLVGHQGSCTTALCGPATGSDWSDLAVARRLLGHSRGHAWSVSIDGTAHFDFTDYAAYYLALPLHALVPLGSADGHRALRLTSDTLDPFLAGAFGRGPGLGAHPGRRGEQARSW